MAARLPNDENVRQSPRANSQVQGYDSQIGARRNQQQLENNMRAVDSVGKSLDRVDKVIDKQYDNQQAIDLADAKTKYLSHQIDLQNTLQQDDDYSQYESTYQSISSKGIKDISDGIANPVTRQLFEASAANDYERGRAQVLDLKRRKEIDHGKAWTSSSLDTLQNSGMNASTPEERNAVVTNAANVIETARKAGFIGDEEAFAQRAKWTNDYGKGWLQRLTPEQQLKLLSPAGDNTKAKISQVIVDAAKQSGVDPATMTQIAMLESNGKPWAVNPTTGATGLFQFTSGTAKDYQLSDASDPVASAYAAARLLKDNQDTLTKKLGRAPTQAELYLAHQQGAGGAVALLSAPDANVLETLTKVYKDPAKAKAAIENNGGSVDMTSGQFAQLWGQRFATAPKSSDVEVPYFPKTGTPVDFINPAERMQLYNAARQKEATDKDAHINAVMDNIDAGNAPTATDLRGLKTEQINMINNYYEMKVGIKPVTPEEETKRDVTFDTIAKDYTRDPNSINQYPVSQLRTMLNPDDYKVALKWRQGGGEDPEKAKMFAASEGEVNESINYYSIKLRMDKTKKAEFQRQFRSRLSAFEQQNKRKALSDDLTKIGDALIMPMSNDGSKFNPLNWGTPKRAYEVTAGDANSIEVPSDWENAYITRFRQKYPDKSPPSDLRPLYLKSLKAQ